VDIKLEQEIAGVEKAYLKERAKFNIGDTVKVFVKIIEGKRERIQAFEGIVISKKGHGISKTFKVRKIAYGVGVEKTFPVNSPIVDKIEVIKRGSVRRAKLFYLRDRIGKRAQLVKEKKYKR
jgi:large subunit ribosomal protein L19